ncbi:MAG TPA: ABC transporter permease [Terriglobales bacterium]|jgi:putative ABC transport system permease protein|nr:ABC transporter permease [Terriglobales bacterium]
MMLRELIVQGWQALMRNRLRSLLTMLGIVWGLASVVLLLAYGEGVSRSVLNAFLGIGNNVIMVWQGQTSMQAGGQRAGRPIHFEFDDLQAIRDEVPIVKAVSGEWDDDLGYKYGTRVLSVSSKFVELPYAGMRRLEVGEGRFFSEDDFLQHRRVVIFGPDAAKKVFGNRSPVGLTVNVNGQEFEVIGLLHKKVQDSSNNGPDNTNAFLPFYTLRDLLNRRDPEMIVFQPIRPELNKQSLLAVRTVLARRHDFDPRDDKATPEWDTIEDGQEIAQFNIALDAILGLIGALTLGVGGVGVMNIMLVSVTERTREIGLRKALGARPRHILVQFLIEALVLTFAGGLVGILVAMALAQAIPPMPLYADLFKTQNHEGDIFLRTSGMVMGISFLILTVVGVFSGFWPALKASRLNPIEALRYE